MKQEYFIFLLNTCEYFADAAGATKSCICTYATHWLTTAQTVILLMLLPSKWNKRRTWQKKSRPALLFLWKDCCKIQWLHLGTCWLECTQSQSWLHGVKNAWFDGDTCHCRAVSEEAIWCEVQDGKGHCWLGEIWWRKQNACICWSWRVWVWWWQPQSFSKRWICNEIVCSVVRFCGLGFWADVR